MVCCSDLSTGPASCQVGRRLGYSSLGGIVVNPFLATRWTCGSFLGSVAAVAAVIETVVLSQKYNRCSISW